MRFHYSVLLACIIVSTSCSHSSDVFKPKNHLDIAQQYDVVIERDNLGVPHIMGKTDADTAFGFAFAQAEDNWQLIQDSIPLYRGTNAKYQGPDGAIVDYLIGWLGLWKTIDEQYLTDLRPDTRAFIEAFADGINYYAALHPDKINPELFPMTGKDVVAGFVLRHLLFYGFDSTVRELTGPERQREISQPRSVSIGGLPVGSNAFAVAPHRSEDGATRMAINSHQPTTGPVAWYEAHIQSEEGLDIMGGLFPGSPTISVGFTNQLAWGATVNRPDLVDVYALELDPDNELRYRLDGAWLDLEVRDIDIEVTLWGWLPWSATEPAYKSVHGPVMKTEHGSYAVRYAGMNEIRQVQQWLDMNKAQNFDQWRDAMRTQSFASFNFTYADADGNIMFVHNSLTPRRKAGYDWTQYLPGNDSSLIWQDYLPFDDLPQVINPEAGFVFSANQTPFQVTHPEDNPNPDGFRPEDGFPTRMTNRAHRGLELFDEMGSISAAEFSSIKHDKQYSANSRVAGHIQKVLQLTLPAGAPDHHHEALRVLARWDFNTNVENTEAAMGVCIVSGEWLAEQAGNEAPDVMSELVRCADMLNTVIGSLTPRWGDVNRHVRGPVNVAVGGGPDTLRAIYGLGLEEEGFHTNIAGDGLYYLVSWNVDGELAVEGIHQFGSATLDESSPHYADQALDYASEILRNPLFKNSERAPNVKARYRPGEAH